jgi:hypothetical protein
MVLNLYIFVTEKCFYRHIPFGVQLLINCKKKKNPEDFSAIEGQQAVAQQAGIAILH